MLYFNELRITNDGKKLIIDLSVDQGMEFDQILLDTHAPDIVDGCTRGTSQAFLVASSNPEEVTEKVKLIPEGTTALRLELKEEDLSELVNFDRDMFHVFVLLKGDYEKDPCGCDIACKTVVNFYPIYQRSIYYLKELNECCTVPRYFPDLLLRIKAVEMAIKTGNYLQAHLFWDEIFELHKIVTPKTCGCRYEKIHSTII